MKKNGLYCIVLYVHSVNPSQYGEGSYFFIRNDDSCDRTLIIYIVLFIYVPTFMRKVKCKYFVTFPQRRSRLFFSLPRF